MDNQRVGRNTIGRLLTKTAGKLGCDHTIGIQSVNIVLSHAGAPQRASL